MAREITQRQRAEANDLYNHLISPMWKGTAPDAARERIFLALQHARQEALREAMVIIERAAVWTPQSVLAILDRLARERVKGDGQ